MKQKTYKNEQTKTLYKIPEKYLIHLKGFKYEVSHMQDELFKVIIYIEKTYLKTEWLTIFKEDATIFSKNNMLEVHLYLDFERF